MRRAARFIAVVGLGLAACGGSDGAVGPPPTEAPGDTGGGDTLAEVTTTVADTAPVEETTTTAAPAFDISMVEQSVVKIYVEGTFVDPEIGTMYNRAGGGSGAIVSEDGLVITNNHVVTGAALIRVYLAGENEPVNARVLGVDECADLAVIQLEGDGYVPLTYREEPVTPGLEIYVAGYPGTDVDMSRQQWFDEMDYTLTRGIISNLTADGETFWASVDGVLEHDATAGGGNSGGPVVDADGHIVGFHYKSNVEDQGYAIAAADARPIIDRLAGGEDVDSIGVNGQAVYDEAAGISGIWVTSVKSGSPADLTGIEPGDIITTLEGLVVGLDGTMSDYCDVIRTQGDDAVMDVEVLRYATEEVLEGQLNGEPLELSFSFAQTFDDEVAGSADTYDSYMSVSDDTGMVTVDVPTEWSDIDGSWNDSFGGPSIYAAPDLDGFADTWTVPGLILEGTTLRTSADIDSTLDEVDFNGACTYGGRQPYSDPLYAGSLDVWLDCGGTSTTVFTVAVSPDDGSFLARLLIQVVEDRDLDAADHIFNTFVVTP